MSDMTFCEGKGCKIKVHCYRFMAPRRGELRFASFVWDKGCKGYQDILHGRPVRRLEDGEA